MKDKLNLTIDFCDVKKIYDMAHKQIQSYECKNQTFDEPFKITFEYKGMKAESNVCVTEFNIDNNYDNSLHSLTGHGISASKLDIKTTCYNNFRKTDDVNVTFYEPKDNISNLLKVFNSWRELIENMNDTDEHNTYLKSIEIVTDNQPMVIEFPVTFTYTGDKNE